MTVAFDALTSARRCSVLAVILFFAVGMPLPTQAATAADQGPSVTAHTGLVNTSEGIAIKGYDPVAYFTEGRPVLGDPAISASFDGAIWQFTTPEHRRVFLEHPTRYEPEYGGFCAYGAAKGYKTDIDPAAFSIIGGRLYLNANLDIRTVWRSELLTSIAEADRNWAEVKEQQLLR